MNLTDLTKEQKAKLADAGRQWLHENGITMTDAEIELWRINQLPTYARLGISLNSKEGALLLRAYRSRSRPY
jgi:hypothetical protein